MKPSEISLHEVIGEADGKIVTANGQLFDTDAYSRFKYGDVAVAMQYGQQLTELLIGQFRTVMSDCDEPLVVTASAYKSLPTAAQAVADATATALEAAGLNVYRGRVYRDTLTEGDYGSMSLAERQFWMSKNGLWVKDADFMNRHVVVVDDVRISGSHEKAIKAMFESVVHRSLTIVHVLTLTPELAFSDPKIEDRMNHSSVKSLEDLLCITRSQAGHRLNARFVKFILSQPSHLLRSFLYHLPLELVDEINEGVISDGYNSMLSYAEAAHVVADTVARMKLEKSFRTINAMP